MKRYADTVHNSDNGAVLALVDLALAIEERRLGLAQGIGPQLPLAPYPETHPDLLHVAEPPPGPAKRRPVASGARGGRRG